MLGRNHFSRKDMKKRVWQFGGECAYFSPLTGSEPNFEPEKWNEMSSIKKTHNCYAYVMDLIRTDLNKKPQPGYSSGYGYLEDNDLRSCDNLYQRMVSDNPSSHRVSFEQKCPLGYRKGFLAIDDSDDPDYHFYRLDNNGYWSHKPGETDATMLDGSKKQILNPQEADRKGTNHNYTKPCAFFCFDPKQARISNKIQKGGKKKKVGNTHGKKRCHRRKLHRKQ